MICLNSLNIRSGICSQALIWYVKNVFFFRVDLEGTSSDYVHVKANVVIKELRLLAENGSLSTDCLRFGSTYYGTDVIQKCFLYNSSPKMTSYVIVLEEHGGGQEIVCDQI